MQNELQLLFELLKASFHSLTSRQAASASPVNLLEMPVLFSRARPTSSKTLREGPSSLCFSKTCRSFWCALKSGSHCSKSLDLMSGGAKTYGTCLPSCWISSDLWTQHKVAHSREKAVLTFLWGFWPCHMTYGIFVPWPGIESRPLLVKVSSSSPWTDREFAVLSF